MTSFSNIILHQLFDFFFIFSLNSTCIGKGHY